MDIQAILGVPQTAEAMYMQAQYLRVRDFLAGRHKVLQRKDFTFKDETFETAKIILQSVPAVVDFHASYICGNPVTLTGESAAVKTLQGCYNRANYALIDYKIADDLVKYGNAFEYVYKAENRVYSKVFDPLDSFPVYDDKGIYRAFVEHWSDTVSGVSYYNVYEPDTVTEYSDEGGTMQELAQYRNLSGLPIHYTSGVQADYSCYGRGIVSALIPIVDELESLLSKASDAVTTLSLNPLAVATGQRIDAKIDRDLVGACVNLEEGGNFGFASASIDYNTVKLLIEQLINQFYTVAEVPSVVFNGNVSNVSETSLKLLFTQLDSKAKRTVLQMKEGFYSRWEYMRQLMPEQAFSNAGFDSLDAVFNLNRPTDNAAIVSDLCKQYEAGALSKQSFIEQSPYTNDAEQEMKRIAREGTANAAAGF